MRLIISNTNHDLNREVKLLPAAVRNKVRQRQLVVFLLDLITSDHFYDEK